MAPSKKTARKSNSRKNGSTSRKSSNGNGRAPRVNYKAKLEALQAQVADVHLMLDAIRAPQNCGTLNGRMVEFARAQYRKYGTMTNPGNDARLMLEAVEAPVAGDGPPWSLYSS